VVINYTVITDLGVVNDATTTSLQGIQNNLTGNYALGSNIDASPAQNWASATGTGFEPIGTLYDSSFTGQFHGLGHTISNLTINSARTLGGVGLFGEVGFGGWLRDVGLINASVISSSASDYSYAYTGALVGENYHSTISNAYATGSVSGNYNVGGLIGSNSGTINNAYATGNVSGRATVGGLVGSSNGTISTAYATGSVSGNDYIGGLVGSSNGTISTAYATGSVSGSVVVGGLVGISSYGAISNAYATGSVSGSAVVGGLLGSTNGAISNAYATGSVSGNYSVGGLVGSSYAGTIINNAYATGSVSGNYYVGGLVGANINNNTFHGIYKRIDISNVHATGSVSGTSFVGGLVGKNAAYGTISNAFATGNVSGSDYVGGLVGSTSYGAISNSYATGNVNGNANVGGLGNNYYYGSGGTISNSHYNIDQVLINGGHFVTQGGIYDAQYQDWVSHNQALNISDYAATLPLDTNTDYYSINNLQSLRDLLGFADNPTYKFRLNTDIDLTSASGFFIPDLAGEFDGTGHILSNLTLNQSFTSPLGLFGMVRETGAVKNVGLTNVEIIGGDYVGGLIGLNSAGDINNAYATGSVSGHDNIGGLVGGNNYYSVIRYPFDSLYYGTISNSYATGRVYGWNQVGGLVGNNYGTINNAYATGNVSGTSFVGGLVGYNYNIGTINNAFWNTETTGKDINSGIGSGTSSFFHNINNVSGKTTAEMMQLATFSNAGWDIANTGGSSAIWRIYEGQTAPLLRSFLTPLSINNITKTYNGLSDSVLSYSIDSAPTSGHLFNQTDPYNGAKNVGSYTPTGLYSDQQGYDISYVDGVLTINKANLLITANDANKIYDGLSYSGGNGVRYAGFVNGETNAVLFGNLNYGGNSQGAINVGSYWITPTGLNADNYQISYQDGQLTIDPAPLTDGKQPAPIRYNLEDQLVPLQIATTFSGKQKTQPVKQDDSEATIVIEKGGIKLPDGIPFIAR
jgi:hypothetical protein